MTKSYLTPKDMRILSKLTIPQPQKVVIEDYWSKNKSVRVRFLTMAVVSLVFPAIIATLISGHFVTWMNPFINIAVAVTWLLMLVFCLARILIALSVLLIGTSKNKAPLEVLLKRHFIKELVKPSMIRRVYVFLVGVGLFVTLASLGYVTTPIFVALIYFVNFISVSMTKESLKSTLERLAEGNDGNVVGKREIVIH